MWGRTPIVSPPPALLPTALSQPPTHHQQLSYAPFNNCQSRSSLVVVQPHQQSLNLPVIPPTMPLPYFAPAIPIQPPYLPPPTVSANFWWTQPYDSDCGSSEDTSHAPPFRQDFIPPPIHFDGGFYNPQDGSEIFRKRK